MTPLIKMACRVIKRRMDAGELFDDVVKGYPVILLDEELMNTVKKELGIDAD